MEHQELKAPDKGTWAIIGFLIFSIIGQIWGDTGAIIGGIGLIVIGAWAISNVCRWGWFTIKQRIDYQPRR